MIHVESSGSYPSGLSSSSQHELLDCGRDQSRDGPLARVVVCLTGLPPDQKTQLHSSVEELGGKYVRDLDTSETTHLIASGPEGAKYQTARSCSHISIVSPEWLVACAEKKSRVDEEAYQVTCSPSHNEGKTSPSTTIVKLMDSVEKAPRSRLFSSCHFFLMGFDGKEESSSCLDSMLCKFIRRARGSIYWQMNESITHIIVNDQLKDEDRDVARTLCLNHPNGPVQVSPLWVLSSLKEQALLPASNFFPQKQASAKVQKPSKKTTTKRSNARLFRGSLFALLRLTPPKGTVDFDTVELERLISSHGGQLLSGKWIDALKADSKVDGCKRRTCFVVTWGGYNSSHVAVHPLLSQIKRYDLCNVILVTPIWLQTCVKENKEISPSCHPLLFEPQSWPICRIVSSSEKKKDKERNVRACVTGFVGSERTALIYLLGAIGATYTDNMKSSNTHLICKVGKGPKYEKAIEWGLQVVSVEWLYHVMQYGYGGKTEDDSTNSGIGCEDKFPLSESNLPLTEAGDAVPRRKKRRTLPKEKMKPSL